MPRGLPNPRLVKIHRSYTVEELAKLFDCHDNTIRRWIKDGGLPTIDAMRPTLINGQELRDFLTAARRHRRTPCGPGRFFCFGCKVPRAPAGGMVDFVLSANSLSAGQFQALCPVCERLMQRRGTREKAALAMPGVVVHYRVQEST